ncbi:MAG: FecR domain-containing protein, partial [Flammeovirgaceae bacterium]
MKEDRIDIDVLLSKALAGEASVEEQLQVDLWLQESADNQKHFDHMKLIFEKAASTSLSEQFDADVAWQQVKSKLNSTHEAKERKLFTFDWRIAASIAAILGVASLLYFTSLEADLVRSVAAVSETKSDTLPDGSTVFLNKKSELQFTFNASSKSRKVKLKGEAFFQVKHEETKPFIIEADEVLV